MKTMTPVSYDAARWPEVKQFILDNLRTPDYNWKEFRFKGRSVINFGPSVDKQFITLFKIKFG